MIYPRRQQQRIPLGPPFAKGRVAMHQHGFDVGGRVDIRLRRSDSGIAATAHPVPL
ncbi:hypothetical protein LC55x_2412 [Lysobacter capsici]|nr:hypothetical protein LC55x_2412 [Lysobacter capsici]